MAIKATIFKAELSIADIDHGYYADHSLTLARHPSETDERMMMRLVALAYQAHLLNDVCNGDGHLEFGAGLSDPNEPDVWLKDFTGAVRCWIEVGQPDDKALSKACGKSERVMVYSYHHASEVWFKALEGKVSRLDKLTICNIASEVSLEIANMASRTMRLQATVQEGVLMFGDDKRSVHIEPVIWKASRSKYG